MKVRPKTPIWAATLVVLVVVSCAREESAPARDILGTEKKLYSQNDEELIIRDFFQDRRNGFFVDLGASDPKRNSTTYYLEKHLGWSGLAIDALPRYAQPYARQRPNTKFFNYIVTDHHGTVDEFYMVNGMPELSSTIKDRKVGDVTLNAKTIKIPTMTLDKLLDDQGVKKIDFISIDIERGAPKALAAFDINRFKPELICIEAGAGDDYRKGLHDYFQAHGYQRLDRYLPHDYVNWYYTPRG